MRLIVPQQMYSLVGDAPGPNGWATKEDGLLFEVPEAGAYMLVEFEGAQYLARYVPGEWARENIDSRTGMPKGMLDEVLVKTQPSPAQYLEPYEF